MKIKICKYFPKIKKFHDKLNKAFPNDDIIIKPCIKMCKRCIKQPVAKMGGVKIKGKSIAKVIEKIEKLKTPDNSHLAKKKR
ncbi:MAG: DUF1450 domain-containing protein [Sulfurovum sp.]|nr:DUF1450 domain-containing protein [Sulfurovum sp.]